MDGSTYRFWVGIDWATADHQVCVLDAARRVLLERSYPHSGVGLAALANDLDKFSPNDPPLAQSGSSRQETPVAVRPERRPGAYLTSCHSGLPGRPWPRLEPCH